MVAVLGRGDGWLPPPGWQGHPAFQDPSGSGVGILEKGADSNLDFFFGFHIGDREAGRVFKQGLRAVGEVCLEKAVK